MSSKPDLTELLELAKSIATRAGMRLLDQPPRDVHRYVHCLDPPREIKSIADTVLEADILRGLAAARLPILSEESGHAASPRKSEYRFIVDPLDGTFNFVKGLGPSAVSIALWNGQRPVFGVIFNLLERQLAWGGPDMGAYAGDRRISVSCTSSEGQASICTGLPVRFDTASDLAMRGFCDTIRHYAKVRMLGSAAVSLLQVARGSADVYAEQNIMLWDVAAGLAIVQGAGGRSSLTETGREWCYGVIASNASLFPGVASRAECRDRI
jgi:myo-inositol-1(or 4)-monophosphatase